MKRTERAPRRSGRQAADEIHAGTAGPSPVSGAHRVPSRLAGAFAALAAAAAIAAPADATAAGFDCTRATRQIDRAICDLGAISTLDGRMAAAFKVALAARKDDGASASVRAGQKAWLAERDRRCRLENVTPKEGREGGPGPRQLGQLICLQAIYPPRIAWLMDLAAPPLVPLAIGTVPIEPLRAAYPDDWRQAGYQALFSPDKTLMALGVENGAGYVMQVWLYQPASGRLAAASPRTHKGRAEKPEHISELNSWTFGRDGRFYLRARRPGGEDGVFGADLDGYAQLRDLPSDVAETFAAFDAARRVAFDTGEAPGTERPPGFDDDSYNEQEGGAFVAWAQNKGHGSFDLMAARAGDGAPRIIASGGWELKDFQLDPGGRRLFYNGDDGLLVTDPDSGVTRRLKGTHGGPGKTRPITMSADGEILVYAAGGSCARDAADEASPDADGDGIRRVCLAYLAPAGKAPVPEPVSGTTPTTAAALQPDPWTGTWQGSGAGSLSATIRRGTAKPDYLVINLTTAAEDCSGAVTLYGKPENGIVLGQSYDPHDPAAPTCRVELSLDKNGTLKAEVAGPCTFYHGTSCSFDGRMTRGE